MCYVILDHRHLEAGNNKEKRETAKLKGILMHL